MKQRSGRRNEEEQLHRGADRLCVEASRTRRADLGGVPKTRDSGANALSLEEQARRKAAERHEAVTVA